MNLFDLSGKVSFGAAIWSTDEDLTKEIVASQSDIIFILKGEIYLNFSENETRVMHEGEIFFLPPGIKCSCLISKGTQAVILRVGDLPVVCFHFFPPEIIPEKDIHSTLFYTLPFKSQINRWLTSIKEYIKDGTYDEALIEIKTFELFYLIKCCYPPDKVGLFFAPAMREEYKFALFVLSNYTWVKTAEELARLSNYSFSAFEKQFRKVFGTAPYRWMLRKKVDKVYREIYETSTPLKVVADEFGFSGLSQLSDFCKKHFGLSPVMIRNKRKINKNYEGSNKNYEQPIS